MRMLRHHTESVMAAIVLRERRFRDNNHWRLILTICRLETLCENLAQLDLSASVAPP
jgi:hypothetical protein